MKRILSLLLAAVLILGAAYFPSVHADEAFRFTRENFPILDGSTSLVPLGQGIASVLLGESREEASDLIRFNRTTQSFRNLRDGQCDIVIAAEPKSEVFEEMASAAFPYLMETIAKEALVFVVNADNPVNSLTSEQLRGIYSGEITNWKEVGGEDLPIVAFQRNPTAGSQVMMEKLVMQGTPMMDAPATMVPMEMAGLIDAVRGYDNSANAIGYTVYYYATDMQMAKGLKILAVDGVLPSADTIRSEEYPYINGYYCCISANESADSPARRLYDWLVSDAGQTLLNLEGYVAVSAPGEAETDGADIVTDYSSYSPNGGTQATYTLFDCPHDRLEASDDYGLLYAYKGPDLYGSWEYDGTYDYWAGSQMGLYNHDGQLITDPVFSSAVMYQFEDTGDWFWFLSLDAGRGCIASKDGSFVSDYVYGSAYPLGDWIVAVRQSVPCTFDVYDRDFRIVKTQEDFLVDGNAMLPWQYARGRFCGQVFLPDEENPSYALLDEDGNVLLESPAYICLYDDGSVEVCDENWNATIYDPDLKPISLDGLETPASVFRLNSNFFEVAPEDGDSFVVDSWGNLVAWDFDYCYNTENDGFTTVRDETQTFYDARGRVLFTGNGRDWAYIIDDIISEVTEDGLILHKLPEDQTLFIPQGRYAWMLGDKICISCYADDEIHSRIADRELNLLPETFGELSTLEDRYTGEEYILAFDSYGFSGEQRLLTPDAQTELFRANGSLGIQDGFITVTDDWAFTCYDKDGNVIFCYPYFGMGTGD